MNGQRVGNMGSIFKAIGFLVLAYLGCVSCLQASFLPYSYNTSVDAVNSNVTFSIAFSSVPDFTTIDDENRQASSFQFWVDPDNSATPLWDGSAIIRGSEINIGGVIPIRDRVGSGGAASDGWGLERDNVSYNLSGTNLSFIVSYDALGQTDDDFSYQFLVTEYGEEQYNAYGESGANYRPVYVPPVVPEPSVFSLLLIALGVVYMLRMRASHVVA